MTEISPALRTAIQDEVRSFLDQRDDTNADLRITLLIAYLDIQASGVDLDLDDDVEVESPVVEDSVPVEQEPIAVNA